MGTGNTQPAAMERSNSHLGCFSTAQSGDVQRLDFPWLLLLLLFRSRFPAMHGGKLSSPNSGKLAISRAGHWTFGICHLALFSLLLTLPSVPLHPRTLCYTAWILPRGPWSDLSPRMQPRVDYL